MNRYHLIVKLQILIPNCLPHMYTYSDDEEQPEGDGTEEQAAAPPPPPVKRSAWAKPSSRKPHKGAGSKNKHKGGKVKQQQPVASAKQDSSKAVQGTEKSAAAAATPKDDGSDSDGGTVGDSDNENDKNDGAGSDHSSDNEDKKVSSVEDDDEEWEKFQKKLNKREKLEGKSKISHSVHCPYFPEDKQEYWWTYICDRKSRTLLTAPYHVTNLVEREEVQLKFTAPRWPGVYTFSVCLRSGTNTFFNFAFIAAKSLMEIFGVVPFSFRF